jgi:thiol-disulfide isomerase/thioredoxin
MDKTIKIAIGLFIAVALVCAIIFAIPHPDEKNPVTETGIQLQNNVTVFFFYGEECPHCHNVMPFIDSLRQKYPVVNFQILEIWHNTTNQALSLSINQKLGVKNAGVPEVIIGNTVLIGERDIPAKLESAIIEELKKTVTDKAD